MLSLHGLQGLLELHKLLILLSRASSLSRARWSLALLVVHEVGYDVYRYRKYDGAIVLCRDTVESLQISQLKQVMSKTILTNLAGRNRDSSMNT